MTEEKGLSKSKYTKYYQCPKMLWMDTYKSGEAVVDESVQKRFNEGTILGDLAKSYFCKFEDLSAPKFKNPDGKPNTKLMIAETEKLIKAGADNICEAAFSFDGCYCAVDILHKENGGYSIYEVKSSTHAKEVYFCDIAYQKWVLDNAGINVTGVNLLVIDNTFVRHGKVEAKDLFKKIPVDEDIKKYYVQVEQKVAEAKEYLKQTEEPEMKIGTHCSAFYDCAYWQYCTKCKDFSNTVFNLKGFIFKNSCKHYLDGIITFEDLLKSGEALKPKQLQQIDYVLSDKETYCDKDGVRQFLSTLSYPLYFLDFETFASGLPLFDGIRPYQAVPFQYSLHYIEKENGELHHKEYLAGGGYDPRREIAQRLVEDIPDDVCVLAYSKSFECGRLKELAALFPEYDEHLTAIANNLKDLEDVFTRGYVYNGAMGKRTSIKVTLPALYPDDPELDYHKLDGVHNGEEATDTFLRLNDPLPPEEAKKMREDLLRYCKLDTYAMVKIFWWLDKRLKEDI